MKIIIIESNIDIPAVNNMILDEKFKN